MRDLEAEMNAALNGKFFWEPTATPDEPATCNNSRDIRRAQKKFAGNAKWVTSRNQVEIPDPRPKVKNILLKEDQIVLEPVLKAIATVYGVTMTDLLGKSTSQKFNKAKRHMCWAIIRYIPGMTFAEAGRIMEKCHTTIKHGHDTFQSEQDFSKVVEVEKLMGKL